MSSKSYSNNRTEPLAPTHRTFHSMMVAMMLSHVARITGGAAQTTPDAGPTNATAPLTATVSLRSGADKSDSGTLKLSKDLKYLIWVPTSRPAEAEVIPVANISGLQFTRDPCTLKIDTIRGLTESQKHFDFECDEAFRSDTVVNKLTQLWMNPQASEESHPDLFFKLPPELRVMVYRHVLISQGRTRVTKDLKIPALLQTSRLIKAEATPIWFNNGFKHIVHECDFSIARKWHSRLRTVNCQEKNEYDLTGGVRWPGLLEGCRYMHCRGLGTVIWVIEENARMTAICGALRMSREFRGQPWKKCERVLKIYRATAGYIDPKWLED